MTTATQTEVTPAVHSTFRIERSYPASPARVFRAFADQGTKRRWFAEGEGWQVLEFTLDFQVGGRELARFSFKGGSEIRNHTTYTDIVADRRIVFAYTMSMDGRCFSSSQGTVEIVPEGDGARLTYTEQGAYFDNADGPKMREEGWAVLLGALARELGPTQ